MLDTKSVLKEPREVVSDADLRAILQPAPERHGPGWRIATIVCSVIVVGAGLVVWFWGYARQKENPGFWHVSLVSMLFWLSITQGMTALSAIIRVAHASWRYPLNRLLDMSSLFGLWVWAILPFMAACRDQIYNLGASREVNNVWRMAGSTFYNSLTVGTAYVAGWMMLYLTAIPDMAALSRLPSVSARRRRVFARLAGFWTGTAHQWRILRFAEGVLVVGVLTAFVGSQTVLGWDFQLAAARDWDSSIFAPLYTLGSLLGGLAMTVLVMATVQRALPNRNLFTSSQYDALGRFMLALGLVWFYFRWCDYLTAWYAHIPAEWSLQDNRIAAFPILAITMTVGCFVVPVFANMFRSIRTSPVGLGIVSAWVLIGLAVQRYLDTVPTFVPEYPISALIPTIPAVTVFVGLSAMYVLTYLIAVRVIPVFSHWGMAKERMRAADQKLGGVTVTVMLEDPPLWET